jgi:hypothetical protein
MRLGALRSASAQVTWRHHHSTLHHSKQTAVSTHDTTPLDPRECLVCHKDVDELLGVAEAKTQLAQAGRRNDWSKEAVDITYPGIPSRGTPASTSVHCPTLVPFVSGPMSPSFSSSVSLETRSLLLSSSRSGKQRRGIPVSHSGHPNFPSCPTQSHNTHSSTRKVTRIQMHVHDKQPPCSSREV